MGSPGSSTLCPIFAACVRDVSCGTARNLQPHVAMDCEFNTCAPRGRACGRYNAGNPMQDPLWPCTGQSSLASCLRVCRAGALQHAPACSSAGLRACVQHALPDIVVQSWTMFRAYARPPTPKTRCKVVSPSARACRADKCLASGFRGCRRSACNSAPSKRARRAFFFRASDNRRRHRQPAACCRVATLACAWPPAAARPWHGRRQEHDAREFWPVHGMVDYSSPSQHAKLAANSNSNFRVTQPWTAQGRSSARHPCSGCAD